MTLENINPFIRRAFRLMRAPFNETVKSADCRLFYILEGNGSITINDTEYQFENDSIGLWPSGTEYCWNFSKNNNCKLAIINFDYTHEFSQNAEMIPLINKSDFNNCTILKSDDFTDVTALNTPIVYPLSQLGDGFMKTILMINPVTAPVEVFRYAVLGQGTVSMPSLIFSAVFTVIVVLAGIMIFNLVEKTFMDTV